MEIKLVAVDLDGTLTTKAPVIPVETIRALQAAMQQGVKIVLATGREYKIAAKIAQDLKLNAPVISYNGGVIRDPHTGETLLAKYIPPALSRRMIKFARAKKLHMLMYMAGGVYTELPTARMRRTAQNGERPIQIANNLLLLLAEDERPVKFLFSQSKRQNDKVYQLLAPKFAQELTVIRSSQVIVEAFLPDVSKGNGLHLIAQHLQIPLAQTMAIGDHDNDISLVGTAGLGVAMGNGSKAVKMAADVVAPTVQEAGVTWAIRNYVLNEHENADS